MRVQDGGAAIDEESEKKADISSEKVNETWERCRGKDAAGPKERNVNYAIKQSDTNKDGKLSMDEMKRLTGAFVKHSGDNTMSSEKLFEILDENADGVLSLLTFDGNFYFKNYIISDF